MNPTFSIIIPVYNVAPYLRECLDSVLAQTFTDWEAICVDDGSTDGSGAILDEYREKVEKLGGGGRRMVVLHQKNAGVSAARNAALDVAKGEWIGFLDGDDVIDRDWLANVASITDKRQVDVVQMNVRFVERGEVIRTLREQNSLRWVVGRNNVLSWGWKEYLENGYSCLNFWRKDACPEWAKARYVVGLPMREDNIFALTMLQWIKSAAQSGYIGYTYRMRSGSAVHTAHTQADQRCFRKSLKEIWLRLKPEMLYCEDYVELHRIYRRELKWKMCASWMDWVRRLCMAIRRRIRIGGLI